MAALRSPTTDAGDYFGARYYASGLGRFITLDWSSSPEAVPYADLTSPQSLNLYAYVGNNTITNVDKDGHICFLAIGNCNPGPPQLPRGPLPPDENHTITVTEVIRASRGR